MVSGDIRDQPGAPVVVVEDDPAVAVELSGTSNGLAVVWVEFAGWDADDFVAVSDCKASRTDDAAPRANSMDGTPTSAACRGPILRKQFSKRRARAKKPMKQKAERSGIAECTGQELPPPAEFSLEHDPEKWKPVFRKIMLKQIKSQHDLVVCPRPCRVIGEPDQATKTCETRTSRHDPTPIPGGLRP